MIWSFAHKGLAAFFRTGSKAGINPSHAARLRLQLARLDAALSGADMAVPAWRLHALKGKLEGHWAVWVDQNWRLTFRFEGKYVFDVNYCDYH